MDFFNDIDLLSIGVAILSSSILAVVIFFNHRKSTPGRAFLLFSLITIQWGIINYLVSQFTDPQFAIWMIRAEAFFTVWLFYFLFEFLYLFPHKKQMVLGSFKKYVFNVVWPLSLLTITPLVYRFSDIRGIESGVILPIFGIIILGLVAISFTLLSYKFFTADSDKKNLLLYIFIGSVLTIILFLIFSSYVPTLLGDTRLTPFVAVSFLPLILSIGYVVLKQKIVSIKVISSEILVFILLLFIIFDIVLSKTFEEKFLGILLFVGFLIAGTLLIRGVLKEVKSREKIEILAEDLKKANERLTVLDKQKSDFVSIASHQLRSPLTAIKGYASLILEGSFGKPGSAIKEAVQKIFTSSDSMSLSIEDFLNVSRIESGEMKYEMESFDLKEVLYTTMDEMKERIKKKKLLLITEINSKETYMTIGDRGKLKQVFSNLIDNSIKYTPEGEIKVSLIKNLPKNKILITVEDTGVGFSLKTKTALFNKFKRSKNAHEVNVSGTGLGLYVAKQMIEAHKGIIRAESKGEGRGSIFTVELPINK